MKNLWWVLAAGLAAYACRLAVHHSTPIDQALPLIAIAVTVLAWATYPAVMVAVPVLIVAEIALADEGLRLLSFGVVLAAVWAAALCRPDTRPGLPLRRQDDSIVIAVTAIVLLRGIPLSNVLWFREITLLLLALAIVFVLGRTPFAVAIAVIIALITPAVPLRTMALPLLVLFVAVLARSFGMPRVKLTVPSAIALGFVMLFFAWSGIVARAFPYFLKEARVEGERQWLGLALAPRESVELQVPPHATSLIVSGANVPRLRRGASLGTMNGAAFGIGDASDWGYMRRDHFFGARNPLPRDPAGKIRDYGYSAWVDGAGRIALPAGAKTIRVTAAANLPKEASLQVEAFELTRR